MNEKYKSLASKIVILILGVLAIGSAVVAYSGSAQVEIETCDGCLFGASQSEGLGASGTRFPNGVSADTTSPVAGQVRGTTFTSTGLGTFDTVVYRESSTNLTVTTTLTATDSGKTFYISGNTSTFYLPATSTAIVGATYRFVVGGALASTSSVKTATGADEIEGTLIVAGAVVDCDAEDEIDFGAAFENIGDYVEFRWSGTYWMLGDSGALTANALSCTKT